MIYLLHFDRAWKGVRHYIGYCSDDRLEARMAEHAAGRGASLTAEMMRQGIGFTVARIYPQLDRTAERRMKNASHYGKRCPICNPQLDSEAIRVELHVAPNLPEQPDWTPLGW